ncbi:alpha/beta hydrolase [Pedobacter cryoconitis]|uniref:Pimeloyl-ACP methyl ester carboxylesterase n=1 Tax=Pedobacter cryoconitis TaxID=188932 RepID=A0A7X0J4X0_9SPHI|nr:alpha/beta hydrolase [Pedobacter cryoconitis]MBB6499691.1 pimeloyl-ACP methyl ester carboxylesterase [Pedobacter cryoconitis]
MKVYFISGLGADQRVFQFLQLPGIEKIYINWVDPLQNEELRAYASRLTAQIDLTREVILVGISFGGIIAQEISRIVPCKKVIIISSVKSPAEFSWQLSSVAFTRIYKLFPARFLKWTNILTADYYFGTQSAEESKLLHQIILDTDNKFMLWAIAQLMQWKNEDIRQDIIHIHGTSDRIFPVKAIKNYIKIEHGGHFMVVNKAEELSRILNCHF